MTVLGHFSPAFIGYAAQQGVPAAAFLVPLSGVIATLGGLCVTLWLLVQFLVPVRLTMHNFWAVPDPMMRGMQMAMLMKSVSMLGAAPLITHFGAGPLSLDARGRLLRPCRCPSGRRGIIFIHELSRAEAPTALAGPRQAGLLTPRSRGSGRGAARSRREPVGAVPRQAGVTPAAGRGEAAAAALRAGSAPALRAIQHHADRGSAREGRAGPPPRRRGRPSERARRPHAGRGAGLRQGDAGARPGAARHRELAQINR